MTINTITVSGVTHDIHAAVADSATTATTAENTEYAESAGTASTATTATKLGTSTVGSTTVPIYLSSGSPKTATGVATASSVTSVANDVSDLESRVSALESGSGGSGGTGTTTGGLYPLLASITAVEYNDDAIYYTVSITNNNLYNTLQSIYGNGLPIYAAMVTKIALSSTTTDQAFFKTSSQTLFYAATWASDSLSAGDYCYFVLDGKAGDGCLVKLSA